MNDENPYEYVTEVELSARPSRDGSMTPTDATVRVSNPRIEAVTAEFTGGTAVVSGVNLYSGGETLRAPDLDVVIEAEDALAELSFVQAVEPFVGGDA